MLTNVTSQIFRDCPQQIAIKLLFYQLLAFIRTVALYKKFTKLLMAPQMLLFIWVFTVCQRGLMVYLAVLKKGAIRSAHPYYVMYR